MQEMVNSGPIMRPLLCHGGNVGFQTVKIVGLIAAGFEPMAAPTGGTVARLVQRGEFPPDSG
jgi:hypothetical protein